MKISSIVVLLGLTLAAPAFAQDENPNSEAIQQKIEQFNQLPPERQERIRQKMLELKQLPKEERRARIREMRQRRLERRQDRRQDRRQNRQERRDRRR